MADKTLSIAELQKSIDTWIRGIGGGYFSELTNMAVLTEEVGELARIMARRFGDQRAKTSETIDDTRLADELADILWVTTAIANQTGIDLTEALRLNIEKKTKRDHDRFLS